MTPEQGRAFAEMVRRSPALLAQMDQVFAYVRDLTAVYRTLPPELRAHLEAEAVKRRVDLNPDGQPE